MDHLYWNAYLLGSKVFGMWFNVETCLVQHKVNLRNRHDAQKHHIVGVSSSHGFIIIKPVHDEDIWLYQIVALSLEAPHERNVAMFQSDRTDYSNIVLSVDGKHLIKFGDSDPALDHFGDIVVFALDTGRTWVSPVKCPQPNVSADVYQYCAMNLSDASSDYKTVCGWIRPICNKFPEHLLTWIAEWLCNDRIILVAVDSADDNLLIGHWQVDSDAIITPPGRTYYITFPN